MWQSQIHPLSVSHHTHTHTCVHECRTHRIVWWSITELSRSADTVTVPARRSVWELIKTSHSTAAESHPWGTSPSCWLINVTTAALTPQTATTWELVCRAAAAEQTPAHTNKDTEKNWNKLQKVKKETKTEKDTNKEQIWIQNKQNHPSPPHLYTGTSK